MSTISRQEDMFGRVKGADWFPFIRLKDILIIGQGGIGSWLTLLLSRTGCAIHTYDHDNYEAHNMSGQLVRQRDINKKKVNAVAEIVREFSPYCSVYTRPARYDSTCASAKIILCGLDNMTGRKIAFNKWKKYISEVPDECKEFFFQDGRLNAEQLQIFNIPGDRLDLMDKYEKEHLFDDNEVAEVDCTFKQTSHCAAMIAAHMVGFLTNWVSNIQEEVPYKQVPFFHEYSIPLNMQNVC